MMESMAEEVVREILLKLPTREVARGRCVSSQWRRLLTDPGFLDLHVHAAQVVGSGSDTEALVVTAIPGKFFGLDMAVFNASSSSSEKKPLMCRVTGHRHARGYGERYRPANACNGFLLLHGQDGGRPVSVCNPITGEKLEIPAPPPAIRRRSGLSSIPSMYAMGYSPSTRQYKVFRLSPAWRPGAGEKSCFFDVCTLGGCSSDGSWRQRPYTCPPGDVCGLFGSPPPALMNGILYMPTERSRNNPSGGMLVIDVTTETSCMYRLPEEFTAEVQAAVYPFEMRGRLCVAVRVVGRKLLHVWAMMQLEHTDDDGETMMQSCNWELRYSLYVEEEVNNLTKYVPQSGAWFDGREGMLCYMLGRRLYKYDTTKDDDMNQKKKQEVHDDLLEWDHRMPLLPAASSLDDDWWNVYIWRLPSQPTLAPPSTCLQGKRPIVQKPILY